VHNPFEDERLRFFLRHRAEIREWAAIEKDVAAATREILTGIQVPLEEQLVAADPDITTTRDDGGRYERIVARRPSWPTHVGIALEWEMGVDPFGSSLPKFGIIFLNTDRALEHSRIRIVGIATEAPSFNADGFKVGSERYWPIVKRTPKSTDWWQDPGAWADAILESLVDLWPKAAPVVDAGLGSSTSPGSAVTREAPTP
jgi:hypothetical protein